MASKIYPKNTLHPTEQPSVAPSMAPTEMCTSIEITIDAPRGSILIMNALTWHKGGNNISGEKRGIIVVEYRNRKLKQLLNLKKYIDKETKKTFSEEENYLFGVREQDFSQSEKSYPCRPAKIRSLAS